MNVRKSNYRTLTIRRKIYSGRKRTPRNVPLIVKAKMIDSECYVPKECILELKGTTSVDEKNLNIYWLSRTFPYGFRHPHKVLAIHMEDIFIPTKSFYCVKNPTRRNQPIPYTVFRFLKQSPAALMRQKRKITKAVHLKQNKKTVEKQMSETRNVL